MSARARTATQEPILHEVPYPLGIIAILTHWLNRQLIIYAEQNTSTRQIEIDPLQNTLQH